MQFLTRIPAFPVLVGTLARVLTFLLPVSAICWVARVLVGTTPHTAQAAAEFLKGPYAVQQAMHMLRDELREIKEDTWTEAIWGSPDPSSRKAVPLKFYFAKDVSCICVIVIASLTKIRRMNGCRIELEML